MKWHRPIVLMAVVALLSVLVFQIQVESTSAERSYTVSIPGTAVQEAARLGLNPHVAWDYGSFHWLQISAADFARLEASDIPFTYEADAGTLQVTRYRFDPLADGEPKLSETERMNQTGQGFRLIQFDGPVNNQRLESLAATGVRILQYYPHHTYLVWGTATQAQAATRFNFVRWEGAFHPVYKMNSDLDGRTGKVENVDIFFYNDGAINTTLGSLGALGANILQYYPAQPDRTFYIANVELDAAAFTAVAQLNTVLWFGYASLEPELEDEMSSQIVAGNHPGGVPVTGYFGHLSGLGYDGSGVRWATVDTGVDYDHPDLGPRIVAGYSFPGACNPPGQPGSDCSGGGHGTHVAGIIGGDATAGFSDVNGFLYGLGVAPGHDVVALNSLSASAWPPAGGWQEHSKQAVLLGAVGGNNSWTTGEGTAHGYQASERTHDIMVRDGNFDTTTVAEPFIEVFSAGNSGSGASTLTAPKEGKNLIIVASSVNYRDGNINTISGFSSRGPAVDGRLGVTVAAPGQQISSARNDLGGSCSTAIAGTNNLYAFCSGTSMAAPHVAGAIALATEWWREFNGGANPSPAMAKALLVNSAVPMATIPNTSEGWGRINITSMLAPQATVLYYDQTHLFTETGQQWTLSVGVPDTSQPLKVTLAWSDAPGAVGANPALVNNLNLTVENSGNTYRGNVFSGGWSTTGGAYDNLNNLENVYVQNPGGSATITIDAANIAGDGVPYNGFSPDQDFALICYNCALFPDFSLTVTPASQSVCAPSNAVFDVAVGTILGFNDPVTLSVMGNPVGTTAGFSQNPVTPPGSSELTIGNIGAAAPGSYSLAITGVAPTSTHTSEVNLHIFTQAPGAPALISPANGALNVPQQATLTWNAAAQGSSYTIQIATDPSFNNIVESATLSETSYTAANLNTSTRYYWRVQATNSCGSGANSSVFTFTTEAAPGDCGPGTTPNVIYEYGFEGGAAGWTTPAGTGTNSWAILTTNPYAGANHYRGAGTASVTDQRLVSPAVALPAGQNPVVLKFWHVPNLENNGASACYDGGILEASTDGTTWTQVPNSDLQVGGYTGPISASFGNPLAGLQAWCSPSTTTYRQTIADVSGYAGQTVQFRWRIGTDSSVSRPGWDVDNVSVQSCQAAMAAILDPASDVTVLPGATAVHQFTLSNLGLDDVYDLAISGGNWSTTLQTSSPVTLTGGSSAIITVAVETPMLVGSDSFTLTVTSQGDPGLVLTAVGTTYTEATYAADLTALSDITAQPGELVTHQFVLTNLDFDDVYELSISDDGWSTTLLTSSPIALSAGMTATIDVSVETPMLLGSDTFTMTVTSQADPNLVLTAVGTTRTEADAGMISSGDSELWGTVGLTITHMIAITNSGALTDTFTLEILSGHTWTTWSDQMEVGPLAPGATAQFAIHVLVGNGTVDTATVRIRSGWDAAIYTDVQITTRTHLVFLPINLKD